MRTAPARDEIHRVHDCIFIVRSSGSAQLLSSSFESAQNRVERATLFEHALGEPAQLCNSIV